MGLTPSDTARAIALIQDGRSKYYVARIRGVSRYPNQVSKELLNDFQKPKAIPEELGQEEKGLQLPGMITFVL
jgi:hypothetical protein